MLAFCASLVLQPMSTSRRTSAKACNLTTSSASLLVTPVGYKGWIFYDPEGKREFVSDTAIFDECCIPGNNTEPIPDFSGPFPPEEGVADGTTSGPPAIKELDDRVGVDAVNDDAPLPLPPLRAVQAPPERLDDNVPKQETPPASPPLHPAASPSLNPPLPPRSGPTNRGFRSQTPQSVPPHPYAHAQDRRSRRLAKQDPVYPELPPPTRARSTPLETVQDDVELNLPLPVEPEPVAPIPSASIEDVSDDDELNLSAEEIEEELEDGHEGHS